jgi:hypothetical protein
MSRRAPRRGELHLLSIAGAAEGSPFVVLGFDVLGRQSPRHARIRGHGGPRDACAGRRRSQVRPDRCRQWYDLRAGCDGRSLLLGKGRLISAAAASGAHTGRQRRTFVQVAIGTSSVCAIDTSGSGY